MKSPTVVVLGVAGMLGHKMFQILRERFPNTLGTAREDLSRPPFDTVTLFHGGGIAQGVDVTDFGRLEGLLAEIGPDYVVNCIGVIKQRAEAASPIPSITINALLPHLLGQWAAKWGGRVIHFSTDCVFSGRRGGYTELDLSDAEDLYGKTKFLGEVASANALTLRTSIIGRELVEHRSLLDWFLSQNHNRVTGYTRVIYAGVTTNYLAEVVADLIDNHPDLNGLYQVASEPISKHRLLCLLKEAYGLDMEITVDDREVSDRSMVGEMFRRVTGIETPLWPALVRALASDPTPYERWI